MAFHSITFALFFALVFVVYWGLVAKRLHWRNAFILLASYIFYGAWDWRFLSLILISSTCDYWLAIGIAKREGRSRRLLLLLSVAINIGILAFFKYFGFFVSSFVDLAALLGWALSPSSLKIVLPVGISFYTFQTLSYTIDVYRGKMQPTRNALAFFSYVAFFPQLVAGPIERAQRLLPQFERIHVFEEARARSACRLLLYGFFKKIVVADRMALLVDPIFADPSSWNAPVIALACLAFGIQIYADFSAYSDIAIGCARLLGFDLMTNFRTPYLAKSLREFWQRWHISLSTWFRDYVYVPLGGNQVSKSRWIINIMITFLLSGLWHGAAYTFLLWGALHGLVLVIERTIKIAWPKPLAWLKTFLIVSLAWIVFRAESLTQLGEVMQRLVTWQVDGQGILQASSLLFSSTIMTASFSLIFLLFLRIELGIGLSEPDKYLAKRPGWLRWCIYYILLLAVLFLGQFANAPQFIYFQF